MKIQITARDLPLTAALRAQAELRLSLALARFAARIGTVSVTFAGSGPDTRCQIAVRFGPRKVRVEDTNADAQLALNFASDRVSSYIARALDGERAWEEGGTWPRPPLGTRK